MKKRTLQFIAMVVIAIFSITSANAQIINKSGDVSGETWTAATYYVTANISVSYGATLTIAPGAVIKFAGGTSLKVSGTLDVNGTSSSNVKFTSMNDNSEGLIVPGSNGSPQPGDWKRIYLYGYFSDEGNGEFDYCTIRYGGSSSAGVYFYYSDSSSVTNSICEYNSNDGLATSFSNVDISYCIFNNNADNGIYTNHSSTLQVSNCQFNNNGNYAAYFGNVAIKNYTNNSGSGNFYDAFALHGTASENITLAESLNGFPYVIAGTLTVTDDYTLTIPEGEVIKFESSGEFSIEGTLDVNGTAANPVIFTSFKDDTYGGDLNNDTATTSPSAGDWRRIFFYGYGNREGVGEIDHCIIRYGGSYNANIYFNASDSAHFTNSVCEYSANIGLRASTCNVDISNSTFEDNADDGIYAHYAELQINNCQINNNVDHGIYANSGEIQINNCQINNNGNYAAYLYNVDIKTYTNNTGGGNLYDAYALSGTASENVTLAESLNGFPFVIIGKVTVSDNNTLTIPEGEVIKLNSSGEFEIRGTIDVNGAAANPVVFTSFKDDTYGGDLNNDTASTTPAPGDWRRIYLYGNSYNDGIGEFDYCIVRYGGSSTANIYFSSSDSSHFINSLCEYSLNHGLYTNSCNVDISYSSFENNADDGIYASGGELQIDNCQFNNNGNYTAYLYNVDIKTYTNNTGGGSFIDAFGLSGTANENVTIAESLNGFPFVIIGKVTVSDNNTLTVPEGEVIKFNSSGEFEIRGTIDVNGTAANPVIFTSFKDDTYGGDLNNDTATTMPAPGDWRRIYLYGNSYNDGIGEFDYCIIRYGGSYNANIYFNGSDSAHFTNSVCEYSANRGLRASTCNVDISYSSFENNADDGIYANSGEIQIDNCQFNNNGNYAAYLSGVDIQTYTNNSGSGNFYDAYALSGTASENITLAESLNGFPYVIAGTLFVNDDYTLTIPEGEVIKFESSGEFSIEGTLDVNGTAANPVVFTSFKDDTYGGDLNNDTASTTPAPGDWRRLYLYGNSYNDGIGEFDYCIVRYGGSYNANIYFNGSDSAHFTNSVCEYSANRGLYANNCTDIIDISYSSFENNADDGIYASGGELQINNCQINNNGNYAAYLYNVDIKTYTNNTGGGNFYDAFALSGTASENVTIAESLNGFPFVIIGKVTVSDNYTLTVPEGEVIKLNISGEFRIYGTIDVNGTATNPVIFTSFKDDT
ncbi:MAG: right-handed parallel beta-helix repeat-containing protein, partial [Bacteroidota bacterium]|nr:right-handed parallel beta-helix repeat-containing protein [Bacteroidota bacterium]